MPTYPFPRPSLTVDIVVFCLNKILLIQRGDEPYAGQWALPGGFVNEKEKLQSAALRELREETGLSYPGMGLTHVGVFADPDRDPRGWVVSVAFLAYVPLDTTGGKPWPPIVKGSDDARDARWYEISALPHLAFDHGQIISTAIMKRTR